MWCQLKIIIYKTSITLILMSVEENNDKTKKPIGKNEMRKWGLAKIYLGEKKWLKGDDSCALKGQRDRKSSYLWSDVYRDIPKEKASFSGHVHKTDLKYWLYLRVVAIFLKPYFFFLTKPLRLNARALLITLLSIFFFFPHCLIYFLYAFM